MPKNIGNAMKPKLDEEVNVRFPKDLVFRAKSIATDQDRDLSYVVRKALEEYCVKWEREHPKQTPEDQSQQRLTSLAIASGRVESGNQVLLGGLTDVGANSSPTSLAQQTPAAEQTDEAAPRLLGNALAKETPPLPKRTRRKKKDGER